MLVKFFPLGLEALALANETILDAARRGGAPIGNSCGGVGICGRCRIRIAGGSDRLNPATTQELLLAAERGFESDERLACQAVVRGDCEVTTAYWGGK